MWKVRFITSGTANSNSNDIDGYTTILHDHFDDGNWGDKWNILFDDGNDSTVEESGTILHINVPIPSSGESDGTEGDSLQLQSNQTFSGENIVLEVKLKHNGYGKGGILLYKDNDNSVTFQLDTNDTPYVQFFSKENGSTTKQQIESSTSYRGDYHIFKIMKEGNQYSAYLDETKKGTTFTNDGLGDSGLSVVLINATYPWKSGAADNYFDYINVLSSYNGSDCNVDITGYSVAGTLQPNEEITFHVDAENDCSSTLYYRFTYHPDYGTDEYDGYGWTSMTSSEWVTDNEITHSFSETGKYIVVVWVVTNASNVDAGVPIVGFSVNIRDNGSTVGEEEPYFPF